MKMILGLLVLMLAVVGCGGGDSGPGVDVTGTWRATASDGSVSVMVLRQDANGVVTGTVDGIPVTGSVDGSSLSLGATPAPSTTLTIAGGVDGNSMSGTYEVRSLVANQSGTFTATRQ